MLLPLQLFLPACAGAVPGAAYDTKADCGRPGEANTFALWGNVVDLAILRTTKWLNMNSPGLHPGKKVRVLATLKGLNKMEPARNNLTFNPFRVVTTFFIIPRILCGAIHI